MDIIRQPRIVLCAKSATVALLAVLFVGTLMKGLASGEQALPSSFEPSLSQSAGAYIFKTFPHRLLDGFKESFFQFDNLAWLALAGGAASALQGPDKSIRTYFLEERPFQKGKEIGNILGNTGVLFGLTGLTFSVGKFTKAPSLAETGQMMFEALSVTAPVTTLFKIGVSRRRPDNSDTLSFPSGHASGSFTLATVVTKQYGPLAGIPAYLAATWVAMSRVQKDKHFFSDTLFGATLGTVIGNAVVNVHRREKKRLGITFFPVVSSDTFGIMVSLTY